MVLETLFGLAVLLGLSAFAWFATFRHLIRSRVIQDTPTSRIRSAHQGFVELVGTAHQDEEQNFLLSPLTHSPCLWFRYRVERYHARGRGGGRWQVTESGTSNAPFVIDDGTGRCFVYPARADISTSNRRVWHGSTPRPVSAQAAGWGGRPGREYRYTEELLQDGQLLYCLGRFRTVQPPNLRDQTRQRMAEIIAQWKSDYEAMVQRFDRDGSGELSPDEWEHARRVAELKAYRELRDDFTPEPVNVLSHSPHRRQPYIISTSDPMRLIRRYRWRSMGWGLVALASSVVFVAVLIQS